MRKGLFMKRNLFPAVVMVAIIVVLFIFLMGQLGCAVPEPVFDYWGSVFVTNKTAAPVSVNVDGKSKVLSGLGGWADWDIEWTGTAYEDTKDIKIRIPTDTLYYELENNEVAEVYVY